MLRTTALTFAIGSEVHDLDLNSLEPDHCEEIYQLLLDRAVLVFRKQDLAPEAHVALAESFGPLTELHPMYPHVPGFPIARIRTDAAHPPENEVWHSDLSCSSNPPFVSVLRAAELPPVGGDTLWADLRAVHDSLREDMRAELSEAEAEHTLEQGFRFVAGFGQKDRADALASTQRTESDRSRAVHRILKRHPASGRNIVYVNESFTTRILNVTEDRSSELLSELYTAVRNPRFQVRIRWEPGTVVIWDNWATQHFAVGDYFPLHEREVQRVTVASNARSAPFS
jgi:taurine dioxygenase